MGEWKGLRINSGTGWKETDRETGTGWKALEWEYEDFTTFTEVDIGANRIQKSANHVDHHAYRNETTYLYKDYSASHFGDFTHKIKLRSNNGAYHHGSFWDLTNNIGHLQWLLSYTHIFLFGYGDNLYLRERYNDANYGDSMVISADTWYYAKLVKSGTSLLCYVYSDSAYTTLVDTLDITLHGNWNFRYLFACNTYNSGDIYNGINDIDNYDLGE